MSREDFNYSNIKVEDIMTKALISVNPSTTAHQIAKMMEQGGIGAIIVKENEIPIGIVTDRDYATKIAANSMSFDTPVEKIMSTPLITIPCDAPISSAAEMMSTKKIRKLAVSDNGKITVGAPTVKGASVTATVLDHVKADKVLVFKKKKLSEKHKGKTLCKSGFHKWVILKDRQFDVKQGKLVTVYQCRRCGKQKSTAI